MDVLLAYSERTALPNIAIDLSTQINVFVLGSTYMKLVKELNLKDIPVIDPAIFISRFANLLEFGEETQQVASDDGPRGSAGRA